MSKWTAKDYRVKIFYWLVPILVIAGIAHAAPWQTLSEDGLHDPENPALKLLQQPQEALSVLPSDSAGNKVDWIRALQQGLIQPRGTLTGEGEEKILDLDIVMTADKGGSVPAVLFPHKPHTELLDCSNCHDRIFAREAGKTPISMMAILDGESCGQCHGAVSFPLTECARCHSVQYED